MRRDVSNPGEVVAMDRDLLGPREPQNRAKRRLQGQQRKQRRSIFITGVASGIGRAAESPTVRSFLSKNITIPAPFKTIRYGCRAQLWNRQASIIKDITMLAFRHGWCCFPISALINEPNGFQPTTESSLRETLAG